jgi:glycosyltransferase involved in cell wall biosynthesis
MGSFPASVAVAIEMVLHHIILNVYGKHLAAVIAPSAFLGQKLREWGWRGRVEVVPNFIEGIRNQPAPTAASGELGIRKTDGDVLFVGRLVEEKGIGDFVEAAKRLPEIPFTVIGDGSLRARFDIRDSRFDHITWYGALSPEETTQHIARAAIVVVPSRWYENAPYVVLEAMAAGVPVIASSIGGLPELVRDGETGVLVPPRDSDTLAKTIDALYHDGTKRWEFGQRARAIAAAEYGPERHYQRLMGVYTNLVSEQRRD